MKMVDQTYIGRVFERCIDFIANGIEIKNPYPKEVDEEKFQKIAADAQILYKILDKELGGIKKVAWTGSYTSSTSGDLLINDKTVELKYLKYSTGGTWINGAMNSVMDYGFPRPYSWYMKEYDVFAMLEDKIGKKNVNRTNASGPVSQKDAAKIKADAEFYKEYQEVEMDARRAFVYDVVEYFNDNPDKLEEFCDGIATKSICGDKHTPDILVEYNHEKQTAILLTKEEIYNKLGDKKIKYEKDWCQFYIGKFRCAFAWKNGAGLFNPTLKIHIH